MATIENVIAKFLEGHGLWPQDCSAVIAKMKATSNKSLRWSDDESAYPAMMLEVMKASAQGEALEHLPPKHFARALLAATSEKPSRGITSVVSTSTPGIAQMPTFASSAFAVTGGSDTHLNTDWQAASDSA